MKNLSLNWALRNIVFFFSKYPSTEEKKIIDIMLSDLISGSIPNKFGIKKKILFELNADLYYFSLFTLISLKALQTSKVEIGFVSTRNINNSIGTSIKSFILRSSLHIRSIQKKWINLLPVDLKKNLYFIDGNIEPLYFIPDILFGYYYWKKFRSNLNNAETFTIKGIDVRDLIIDTYIRYYPQAKFNVNSLFTYYIFIKVLKIIRRSCKLLNKYKPDIYISSHSTYIEHGIIIRIAILKNIPVYVFSSHLEFFKKLNRNDYYHTRFTADYREKFAKIKNKKKCLSEAEKLIKKRLSGELDLQISYMKKSAYSQINILSDVNLRGYDVIFAHDFYDSPHVYKGMIFNDFFEWITFTIDCLNEVGLPFCIKKHPNQIDESAKVYQKLDSLYKNLHYLDNISNETLVNAGITRGITVYGSVSNELAYLGIPSVACAEHPHISYDFCMTALNINDYKKYLQEKNLNKIQKMELQNQALEFIYMHNLHDDSEKILLRNYSNLAKKFYEEGNYDSMIKTLKELYLSKEFNDFVLRL